MPTRNELGSETRYRGDFMPAIDNPDVDLGTAVTRDSNGVIQPLSAGDNYYGVKYAHSEAGSEKCTVRAQGPIVSKVDSSMSADNYAGSPATGASPAETAGAFGSSDDQGVLVLEDPVQNEEGTYKAPVLLR